MAMLKVSVVVPAFNEEARLAKCFESIKAQTFKPYEIILGDGSSTDRTRQIAKDYAVKIVVQKERSAAIQRQGAANVAKGDIIAFTDADSIADRDWLKKTVEEFEKGPQTVGVYGPVHLFDGSWLDRIVSKYFFSTYLWLSGLIDWPSMAGMNMAVRADDFRKIGGFDTSLATAEDLDLSRRLKKYGKIRFSGGIVYTSARRIKKWGYLKFFWYHFTNLVAFHTTGKPHGTYENVKYENIR